MVPLTLAGSSQEDAKFDLHINNGQLLEHFHEGNMTYRVPGIKQLVPEVYVEVSQELADARHLQDGTVVHVVSPTGAVKVPVLITDRVSGNELYLPMNSLDPGAVNDITGVGVDTQSDTPAYKETVASMEVLDDEPSRGSPLPRSDWRFQHRHPQMGVMVSEKWARRDYIPLTTAQKHQPEEDPNHGPAHR